MLHSDLSAVMYRQPMSSAAGVYYLGQMHLGGLVHLKGTEGVISPHV